MPAASLRFSCWSVDALLDGVVFLEVMRSAFPDLKSSGKPVDLGRAWLVAIRDADEMFAWWAAQSTKKAKPNK